METTTPAQAQLTPETIFRVAHGFMAAKHLFTAEELGVFRALGEHPLTLEELAGRLDAPPRTLRIVLDAVVALGFVERGPEGYRNGPVAEAFLSGRGSVGVAPLLQFWNRISYPAWTHLSRAVRDNRVVAPSLDRELQAVFSEGVDAFTRGTASALADAYDFRRHARLLDIGGGTGSFLVEILTRHEALSGTLFEVPEVAEVARRRLTESTVGERVAVVEGSALADALPRDHDCLLAANVVHLLGPDANVALLQNARQAVEAGATLLLVDFWTDPTRTEPLPAALLAGEFLVLAGGDVYSVEQADAWLRETGWVIDDTQQLAGPASMVVAHAV